MPEAKELNQTDGTRFWAMTESASHVQIIRDARVEGGAVEQSIEKDNINVTILYNPKTAKTGTHNSKITCIEVTARNLLYSGK